MGRPTVAVLCPQPGMRSLSSHSKASRACAVPTCRWGARGGEAGLCCYMCSWDLGGLQEGAGEAGRWGGGGLTAGSLLTFLPPVGSQTWHPPTR